MARSDKPIPGSIDLVLPITNDAIAGLLCSGIEGGYTGQWARIIDVDLKEGPEQAKDYSNRWTLAQQAPLYGGVVTYEDHEDGRKQYKMDLNVIKRGLYVMATKEPAHFGDFIGGREDASTGDIFIQCCLFGEVKYG